MKTKILYKVKPVMTFICPICKWRITQSMMGSAKTMFREHMKYEHKIRFNQVKLLKP